MYSLTSDQLSQYNEQFVVLQTTGQSQLASMILKPGQDSGKYGNEHPRCDQIMIVVEGIAEATVDGKELRVEKGGTVLIAAGEDHQIRNVGPDVLRTVNIYSPPAYDEHGDPL